MGAVFRQKTARVTDMLSTIKEIRDSGKTVCAASLRENPSELFDINADSSVCFIVGNEANGIRKDIIAASDKTVVIPMEKNTESLNAATAASILLYEQYRTVRKQKRQ